MNFLYGQTCMSKVSLCAFLPRAIHVNAPFEEITESLFEILFKELPIAPNEGTETYVAVKVCVAEREHDKETRELQTMKKLASYHPNSTHVVQFLDDFDLRGPIDAHFSGGRLPGKIAKFIAKQSLSGLNDLHQRNIGHGDLHTRNLAFTMPCMEKVSEDVLFEILGKPEIGRVQRHDGKDLELGMSEYIVKPTSYRTRSWNSTQSIKIIDFGESFLCTAAPHTLHTPLSVGAPEVLFQDQIDYHVDLWSMGCMLFELFTGQPPFDTFLITPPILIGQMQEVASDDLPKKWQKIWNTMDKGDDVTAESSGPNL
ncbi:hypothetical protein N7523_001974 [Penicillium sp. IBT 18751x]|nr:hypothetical protein N7523_001974 [Penicillium sp. IBT 18751x]